MMIPKAFHSAESKSTTEGKKPSAGYSEKDSLPDIVRMEIERMRYQRLGLFYYWQPISLVGRLEPRLPNQPPILELPLLLFRQLCRMGTKHRETGECMHN